MTSMKHPLSVLATALVLATGSASLTGCGLLNSDKDKSEETEISPKKEEPKPVAKTAEPAPSAAETAAPEVAAGPTVVGTADTYPDMVTLSASVEMLQSFPVHRGADATSERLVELAAGSWVDLKHQYKDWLYIEWPSGPNQISPGWIKGRLTDARLRVGKKPEGATATVVTSPKAGTTPAPFTTIAPPKNSAAPSNSNRRLPSLRIPTAVPSAIKIPSSLPRFKFPKPPAAKK